MKETKHGIWKIILFALLGVFLLNPKWIPFIGEETKIGIGEKIKATFGQVDSNSIISGFNLPNIVSILLIIIFLCFLYWALKFVFEHINTGNNRRKTIMALTVSMMKYAFVIIGGVWILSVLEVNTAAIFASLGIVGLVLGFGAQSLIEDIITGMFIIFEGHYSIGDIIILDDFRGEVIQIGVRTTCVMDNGGNIKVVNNSDIRNFQNRSKELSVSVCDIGVSYDADLQKVEALINENLPGIGEKYPDIIKDGPYYKGVENIAPSSVVLRIIAFTDEENIFSLKRILNREMKILFDNNHIEIPYEQIVVNKK